MSTRKHTKLLHEGDYVAEVEVEVIDADGGWGPYLSLEDVRKLDSLRVALPQGDMASALKCARVYRLTPITVAGQLTQSEFRTHQFEAHIRVVW